MQGTVIFFHLNFSVLSLSWKRDMSMVFAALADNTVRAYDIKTS